MFRQDIATRFKTISDSLEKEPGKKTPRYVREKNQLRAEINAEEKEEIELTRQLDEKGRLIIEMKTSLQQINQLLSSVGTTNRSGMQLKPIEYAVDGEQQAVPVVESDFDKLLLNARQKLTLLMQAVSRMEITNEIRFNAKQFYHQILARTMRDNYQDEVAAEGGLIEFEMEDPNVPTHAVIKLRCKQLVDAQVSEFDVPDFPQKK